MDMSRCRDRVLKDLLTIDYVTDMHVCAHDLTGYPCMLLCCCSNGRLCVQPCFALNTDSMSFEPIAMQTGKPVLIWLATCE